MRPTVGFSVTGRASPAVPPRGGSASIPAGVRLSGMRVPGMVSNGLRRAAIFSYSSRDTGNAAGGGRVFFGPGDDCAGPAGYPGFGYPGTGIWSIYNIIHAPDKGAGKTGRQPERTPFVSENVFFWRTGRNLCIFTALENQRFPVLKNRMSQEKKERQSEENISGLPVSAA